MKSRKTTDGAGREKGRIPRAWKSWWYSIEEKGEGKKGKEAHGEERKKAVDTRRQGEKKKLHALPGKTRRQREGGRDRQRSTVTANYTIVGRFTMEQLRAAGEQTEWVFLRLPPRRLFYFLFFRRATRSSLSLSLSLSLCTKTFSSPRSVSFGASCAVCCRRRKVIILRSLPARRRDERWRNTGRERGPTWKLISNEPRVKSKLIRFRLAGAALTNQVFLERETFRRVSAIIRRTPRKRTQGSEEGCASHEFSLDSERWWHSLHDKRWFKRGDWLADCWIVNFRGIWFVRKRRDIIWNDLFFRSIGTVFQLLSFLLSNFIK